MNYIYVENTVKALQDIALTHRKRLNIPLIGITGSVGKTTTKEMLWYALSAEKKVFKTPGPAWALYEALFFRRKAV